MANQPGACKPFSKNKYGHPMVEADKTIGYPVDHSHNDGSGGAHARGTGPESGPIGGQPKAVSTKKGVL